MKEINYWQQFLNTGSVEDYLSYKQNEAEEAKKGEHSDAGAFQRYRDDIESGTFRGI